ALPIYPNTDAMIIHPEVKDLEDPLKSFFAEINNNCMHWVEAGPQNKKLLVLLHGYPQYWVTWAKMVPGLVQAGYRVLMPDMRGINGSARPKNASSYQQHIIAEDVRALIRFYRDEVMGGTIKDAEVVAYDTGGMTGWYLASNPQDMISKISIANFPHPALYRQYLLYGDRSDRNLSQYPLSFFVFGQAFMPEIAFDYFLGEGDFSWLGGQYIDGLRREGVAFLRNKKIEVPKAVLEKLKPVCGETTMTIGEMARCRHEMVKIAGFHSAAPQQALSQFMKRYETIFHRLNYEMRWLRMGFDPATQKPHALIAQDRERRQSGPISLEEVKLYADMMMYNFGDDDNQLQAWFSFFKGMTTDSREDLGFLNIPAMSLPEDSRIQSPEQYGKWTAMCSILEREYHGFSDGRFGPFKSNLIGKLVVTEGEKAILGFDPLGYLSRGEITSKILTFLSNSTTNLDLDAIPKGFCQNRAVIHGLVNEDPFRLPQIEIPVQMVWGHHDAYLNSPNFTQIEDYHPHFSDSSLLRLIPLGGSGLSNAEGYPTGSHWSIDEFPDEIINAIVEFGD
ncbi:MAG: alpha/beta fold hydrolase, partial [Pseudomonadota bacterium]